MKLLPRSIRWRLQLWHGLLLLAVLCGFAYTAQRLQWAQELRRVDAELQQRVNELLGLIGRPPGPPGAPREPTLEDFFPLPEDAWSTSGPRAQQEKPLRDWATANGGWFIVWERGGTVLRASEATTAARPRPELASSRPLTPHGQSITLADGQPGRELAAATPRGEIVLTGRAVSTEAATNRRTALQLAGLVAGVWLLGMLGGSWLTGRALRPIQTISDTAAGLSAGRLDQRIEVAATETELGRLATVLNATFARLRQAFDQQARFTADAAHELRTPVTVMLSQTQLSLQRERTPGEYRDALQTCRRAAERMNGLIESLLELAHLDADAAGLEKQPIDLATVATDSAALVESLAAERGLTLQRRFEPAPCLGNPDRLGQIVTNFLSNALRHSPAGSAITVASGRTAPHSWVSVADPGSGIAAEHLPHLFERFYRADPSRHRGSGGAGLGLAICKTIAEAHGGGIDVTSELGVGSTFTLWLPAA
jgi:two-component system, OmpR family, sensor kinase